MISAYGCWIYAICLCQEMPHILLSTLLLLLYDMLAHVFCKYTVKMLLGSQDFEHVTNRIMGWDRNACVS